MPNMVRVISDSDDIKNIELGMRMYDFESLNGSYTSDSNWDNFSLSDLIREKQKQVHNVSMTTEIVLIVIYSVLMVSGLCANLLVSFVVARRRQMHTARNLYIVNLTVSDISLCIVCMPFTLVMILRRQWTLGPVLCKLVHALQGTNIMVSVGTITVIALDRYLTICKRTTEDLASTRRRVVTSIAIIWLLSVLASMPLFFYQGLEPVSFHELVLYEACIEHWPSQEMRVLYDTGVLLVMAVLPPAVVSVVHARIANHLNTHARTQKDNARASREIDRNRRTTLLLSGIVVLLVASWLPLGMFSLLADFVFTNDSDSISSPHQMYTALAVVHICAMTSAVTNPIVYGWMNSNIRREFVELLPPSCANRIFGTENKLKCVTAVEMETMRTQVATVNDRKESIALLVTTSNKMDLQTHCSSTNL